MNSWLRATVFKMPNVLFLSGLHSYFGSPEWSGLVFLMVSGLTLAGLLMIR